MKRVVLLAVVAACGTESSSPTMPDAATVTPPGTAHARIVQQVMADVSGTGGILTIAPTAPGSLVVVVVAFDGPPDAKVRAISTQDRWFAADTGQRTQPCGRTFDVWSGRDVAAETTAFDITFSEATTTRVAIFEVSGMGPYPLTSFRSFAGSALTPTPPVYYPMVPVRSGEIVFSLASTCGTLAGLDPQRSFTAVPLLAGTAVAYALPTTDGSYGTHWSFDGAPWYLVSLAYR
ncbi:MAG TPA: hypothetical protein VK427_01895 [Kofleriaceae bacterium]|nr:hypothetical protein [Kofleriaceae bacterium]